MSNTKLHILEYIAPQSLGYTVQTEADEYGRKGYTVRHNDKVIGGPFIHYPQIAEIETKGEVSMAIIADPEGIIGHLIS